MSTSRRKFLKSSAALIAAVSVCPALALPEIKSSVQKHTFVMEDLETGWGTLFWQGDDIDRALRFGNSGPSPLWGDDFKINPETNCIEFISFFKRGARSESARPGDCIMRAPDGCFFRLPYNALMMANTNQ